MWDLVGNPKGRFSHNEADICNVCHAIALFIDRNRSMSVITRRTVCKLNQVVKFVPTDCLNGNVMRAHSSRIE